MGLGTVSNRLGMVPIDKAIKLIYCLVEDKVDELFRGDQKG